MCLGPTDLQHPATRNSFISQSDNPRLTIFIIPFIPLTFFWTYKKVNEHTKSTFRTVTKMENYFSSTFLSVKEQLHEDEEETKQAIFIWCMVILTQNILLKQKLLKCLSRKNSCWFGINSDDKKVSIMNSVTLLKITWVSLIITSEMLDYTNSE